MANSIQITQGIDTYVVTYDDGNVKVFSNEDDTLLSCHIDENFQHLKNECVVE